MFTSYESPERVQRVTSDATSFIVDNEDHYCLISPVWSSTKELCKNHTHGLITYIVAEMEPLILLRLSSTHISGKSVLRLGTKGLLLLR